MHPKPLRCIKTVVVLERILEILELRSRWEDMATTVEAIVYYFSSNSAHPKTPGSPGMSRAAANSLTKTLSPKKSKPKTPNPKNSKP